MNKVLAQGLILAGLFFLIWFALMRVDWMTVFRIENTKVETEKKLGELFWEIYQKTGTEATDPFVNRTVDSLVNRICTSNDIDRKTLKVHVLYSSEVNAFALPDGHLVIYSGLILASDNQEELCGVIGHETAHIMLRHVMKKLIKEVGLSVLIAITTNSSGDIAKETAKMLSSTAFDRSLEREADIKAVDYLMKADINPEPFADFLYKLSDKEDEIMKYLSWVSTHPDSKERAAYIIKYCEDKTLNKKPVLAQETWEKLKEDIRNLSSRYTD
jgi:predicted Zn-dependent protease